ncbi:MAG: hypothetical protein HC927_05065 [Deltaproteobacteria bacterium]|nr:hypothetical protein [Deltaproteobacteria bacterium]
MRPLRWLWLFPTTLASACGSETVSSEPPVAAESPLTCEPGPEITGIVEACGFTSEGSGAPMAAKLWTFASDDGSSWQRFSHASDGSVYLFSSSATSIPMQVARLGPNLEPEWSRRFVPLDESRELPEFQLVLDAVGDDAVNVVISLAEDASVEPTWVHTIGSDGNCADAFEVAFAGVSPARTTAVLRESDSLVLAGIIAGTRGFIQRRDLAGGLLEEAELVPPPDSEVSTVKVFRGLDGYLVNYGITFDGGYGDPEARYFDASFDELASFGSQPSWGYFQDAFGQLYAVARDEPAPLLDFDPVDTLELTPLAVEGEAPSGRVLSIPQPQCGNPKLAVFDDNLAIVRCNRIGEGNVVEDTNTILGYIGSGEPSWTMEIGCFGVPADVVPVFRQDSRLWLWGGWQGGMRLLVVEFD